MSGAPPSTTVGELGEFGFLGQLLPGLPGGAAVVVGPGDDAAVVRAADGRVVASTDVLVDGRHFRRDWSTARDVGHRAAGANLADIAAMGAVPTALLVGLAAPPDLPVSWALELAAGLAEEAGLVGAAVVGGDTVRADQIMISVTALGDLGGRPPVLRSGARPGDVLVVAGRLGWAAAGLAVLRHGFRTPRALVEALRRPDPPYGAGPAAAGAGATAMIDVSDGLLADVGHLASASGVVVDLDPIALEPDQLLGEVAPALGASAMEWVLRGGDDHPLVAAFPADASVPLAFRPLGRVAAADDRYEAGTVLVGGAALGGRGGHDHFAGGGS